MVLELYFALTLLFFISVNAVAEVEQYVEDSGLLRFKFFDDLVGSVKSRVNRFYHCDDEFYCFFKKDAFDLN
ncbi:hypothetical protein [Desulfovibrio sp. JC010]|uniref:hypothetical protein n=1 Tax=Desulfovibrio sp. JC010 TaxID=2593641 RepID=UPI0013D1A679|nr:hypothetical protein [Desulfovibrio sp. JC010]NDV28188.1 hypothetical protein [Desulfovibrio sp. JC010]